MISIRTHFSSSKASRENLVTGSIELRIGSLQMLTKNDVIADLEKGWNNLQKLHSDCACNIYYIDGRKSNCKLQKEGDLVVMEVIRTDFRGVPIRLQSAAITYHSFCSLLDQAYQEYLEQQAVERMYS
ncbi:hypothetical protein [Alkalicoccobacillus porphyridii]|uniref:Uncharacterized protein n=1 Tax=Alkalicoccobacillus porphyridii TaxID=2597270 RepID=A0A554A084_9BACI|nr:hypothetical protein [Alkalicoccobacillus porphyridii]TSB47102.1 hypothetical protein FN960_08795 [Alkalicoccobacillus porphyridii]